MYRMMSGEREQLIKRLGVYYKQHMSGQNRRKEMLAILVLLDRSGAKISKTAQEIQLSDIEKSAKDGIIKLAKRNNDVEKVNNWITVNGNHIPVDENGRAIGGQLKALQGSGKSEAVPVKSGKKPTLKLSSKEYGKVMHEIDTYFHKRFENREGKTCIIEIKEFAYVFDNNGYNTYDIYRKIKIAGNENLIKKLKEIYE